MDVIGKRRALGRGLGALIPEAYEAPKPEPTPSTVPLKSIQRSTVQPRQVFSDANIAELAESIRQQGIIQPLLVRPRAGGYELIAGERRFRAAHLVGLENVPVTVRTVDDREALELAIIENVQRENLNSMEEARAYQRLGEEFLLTHEQIAERVGKNRSTIANTMRLLQLPDEVQARIEAQELTPGHARALINLGSAQQTIELARIIVAQQLNVRQAERLAKQTRIPSANTDVHAAEEQLTERLGTKVRLTPRRHGSGKIEIEYYSLDQLNGLIQRLCS